VLHLHGDVRDPEAMLLPGERPEEVYREDAANAKITSAYFQAMNVLNYARRVYVVGLSLSPLDAALGAAMGMGLIGNKQAGEVVIVNRSGSKTAKIANQVRTVVPETWSIREMPLE
jgi:hypothetical protein